MSAIFASVGPSTNATHDAEVETLLGCMSHRGSEERASWRTSDAVLAVARDRWEMQRGFAGPVLVAERGALHVVCDATLYYLADLRARLVRAGIVVQSDSAADLIAGSYAAFGPRCIEHLEGDFAFCVWDERTDTLFCARDPFGTRSLYHAELDGSLLVASTSHPLVKRQGSRAAFDPSGVLRSVLMRHGDGTSTAWRGVRELPAGHFLLGRPGRVEVTRYWTAKGSARWSSLSSDDAVQAAAALLAAASKERAQPGRTSLAMSGGQDSTSILASLDPKAPGSDQASVHILSFKFPEGDPGNEDWYVERTAGFFARPVHWVETAGIGFFDDALSRARLRSNGHGHIYEGHNRALARTARGLGSRVLLNGNGGDNLFAVEDWTMADLLRTGRWLELRRFWEDRNYRGFPAFVTYCARPALPFWAFDVIERVLGRHICSRPYERPLPPWVSAEPSMVSRMTGVDRRAFGRSIVRNHSTVTAQRRAYGLMESHFSRTCGVLFDLMRDEGVELRMPFYDTRLVEFVMSRPAMEFNQPGQYKVLLRKAVEGRLPSRTRTLLPSGIKTGTAIGLLESHWGKDVSAMLSLMSDRRWISDELGIVDGRKLASALESGAAHWRSPADVCLTLLTETWLRAHVGGTT